MHRALTIPELLSEIFRIVRESNEEWKPVVSGLSRVCKGFHEPALDELWKTQSCLIPTLLVLHGDAVKVKDSPLPSEDNVDEDLHTTVPTQALVSVFHRRKAPGSFETDQSIVSCEAFDGKRHPTPSQVHIASTRTEIQL